MDRQDIYNFLFIDKENNKIDNTDKPMHTNTINTTNNMSNKTKTTGLKNTKDIVSGVTHEKVNGELVRGVKLNNKKYLFVSDLCEKFGTEFVSKLDTPPIKHKINYGANTQNRYIVTITDFRNAMNKKEQSYAHENVEEQEAVVEMALGRVPQPAQPTQPAVQKVTHVFTDNSPLDDDKADQEYRSAMTAFIQEECVKQAVDLGYVPGSPMFLQTVENLRVATYKDLYRDFRTQLCAYLTTHNLRLDDVGLGYVEIIPGVKNQSFLQRVFDAGYMKDLYYFATKNLSVKTGMLDKAGAADNIPM